MSQTARFKGVPMPPTAWALASMWSAVWDAPRFRGRRIPLQREAVAPLLKIAASCVAALQPHVAKGDRKSRLPPYGASRELLVAALDGSPEGAGLPNPIENPEGFVRALTKASFMTGDGTFADGLSEERLDQLLSEACAAQLAQAGLLVKDPTGPLQAALDTARTQVQELAARPPAPGNLQAVADRLLMAQRLERIAEEARELLNAPAVSDEESVIELDDSAPGDLSTAADMSTGASDEAAADEAAQSAPEPESAPMDDGEEDEEGLRRSHAVASPASRTTSSAPPADAMPAEGDGDKSSLQRTRSQIAASVKVQKVKKHLDETSQTIHELRRTASHMARKETPPDGEISALQAELETIDQARKRARNFGEDLVEDMLALDSLTNLDPEDRSTRKAALAGIESLLQDVDAAKARLNALHQSIQAKLDAAQAARDAQKQPPAQKEVFVSQAAPVPGKVKAAHGQHPSKRAAVDALAIEAPPPLKEHWREVRLPLRFHSREEGDHYTVLASVPGLDTDELKLELSDDERALTVQGLRVPTPQEAVRMQQKISERLRLLAERAPKRFAQIRNDIPRLAHEAYLELGQDEYGLFSETFRVPDDVDVSGIDASYRDGVLRVVLPKVPQVAPHLLYDGSRGGRYAGGRPMGYPGGYPTARAGYPGFNGQAPRGMPHLFGGLDDRYMWR